jgi:hypothetical protein
MVKITHCYEPHLAIFSAYIDCEGCRREIEIDRSLEGQAAITNVPRILRGIERDFHAPLYGSKSGRDQLFCARNFAEAAFAIDSCRN